MNAPSLRYGLRALLLVLGVAALCGCASSADKAFLRGGVLRDYRLPVIASDALGEATALTRFTSDELQGRLSPNGRYLVYASNQKGNLDLWLKDLATGIPRRLTRPLTAEQMPSFSPDGLSVVYVSMQEDVKGDLYLISLKKDAIPQRLTDATTGDLYPVFAPDGKSLFFSGGPEGKPRIQRLWLADKRRESLSEIGATQPAVSPQGDAIAYIQKNEEGLNTLVWQSLGDKRRLVFPARGIHLGFPSFSPDGRWLYVTRFFEAPRGAPLLGNENGSIWRVPLAALKTTPVERLPELFWPITSARETHLFLQATPQGLLYTAKREGSLDIFLEPLEGLLPEKLDAKGLLALALRQEDVADQQFVLRQVARFPQSAEAQEALYRLGQSEVRDAQSENGRDSFERLLAQSPASGDWQDLARIDRAVWEAESTKTKEAAGGKKLSNEQVERALAALARAKKGIRSETVLAYALLREGDLQRYLDRDFEALRLYTSLVNNYPNEREFVLRAKIRIGRLFGALGMTDTQLDYYIGLLNEYGDFERYQRDVLEAVIELLRDEVAMAPDLAAALTLPELSARAKEAQHTLRTRLVARLRVVIDTHPDMPLLGAVLTRKIAGLMAEDGRYDLAAEALERVARDYPALNSDASQALSLLGDYVQSLAQTLREQGRLVEADALVASTLDQMEATLARTPKTSAAYKKLLRQFSALGLLRMAAEERDGDWTPLKKTVARLLRVAPDFLPAHRKTIQLAKSAEERRRLAARYKSLIRRDPTSFVGHYGLGYLAINAPRPAKSDLDLGEREISYAQSLNSQNPYVYLSLGWIAEMRESYLGDFISGWLEAAIEQYDTAYRLNDRLSDPQAEADILLNRGNAFAQMGNTWANAYEAYAQLEAQHLPIMPKSRRALYELNFGRAAYNLDRYDESARHFEAALGLAKEEKLPSLLAEATARLALADQLQGNYDTSTRGFAKAIELSLAAGQTKTLAALTRAIALNHLALGQRDEALQKLDESLQLLERYGARDVDDFARTAIGRDLSLAPRGFSRTLERNVNVSLHELILEDLERFRAANERLGEKRSLLTKRQNEIANDSRLAGHDDSQNDQLRERIVVDARSAKLFTGLGDESQALGRLNEIQTASEQVQSKPFTPDDDLYKLAETPQQKAALCTDAPKCESLFAPLPADFETAVRAANAGADLLLRADARGDILPLVIVKNIAKRLDTLLLRRELLLREGSFDDLSYLARFKLASNAAALSLRLARAQGMTALLTTTAAESFGELSAQGQSLQRAVRLLRELQKATSPDSELSFDPQSEPLARGMTPYLRIRMHIETLLNLAELFAAFEPVPRKDAPPSRSQALLMEAATRCGELNVPDLCLIAKLRSAVREGNLDDANAAIDTYLATPPIFMGAAYLDNAQALRHELIDPAIALAIDLGKPEQALLFSEASNTRLFADALYAIGRDVDAKDVKPLLVALDKIGAQVAGEIEGQSFTESLAEATARRSRIQTLTTQYAQAAERLAQQAPRVGALLSAPKTDLSAIRAALKADEVVLSLLPTPKGIVAYRLDKNELATLVLPCDATFLRENLALRFSESAAKEHAAALATLRTQFVLPLSAWLTPYRAIYADSSRITPDLPWSAWLKNENGEPWPLSRFYSLTALSESLASRKMPGGTLALLSTDATLEKGIFAGLLGQKRVSWVAPNAQNFARLSDAQGVWLDLPLSHEGASPANLWINFDKRPESPKSFAFAKHLDARLKTDWIWINRFEEGPRSRPVRLCLERFLVHFGVAGYLLANPRVTDAAAESKALSFAWAALVRDRRLTAFGKALAATPEPLAFLHGAFGMDADEALSFANASILPTIQAAIAKQQKGAARQAMENYEQALAYIDYAKNDKFLDKTLEMLVDQAFVAGEYDVAITTQKRVLLRAEEAAKQDPTKREALYKAKATQARNLTQAQRYDEALAINKEIIEAREAAKEADRLGPSYAQRGLILELANRFEESFKDYEKSYQLALAAKDVSGQLGAARNAARILRQRLSDYRRAMRYLEKALIVAESSKADVSMVMALKLEMVRNAASLGDYAAALAQSRELAGQARARAEELIGKGRAVQNDASLKDEERGQKLSVLKGQKEQMDAVVLQATVELVNTLWQKGRLNEALTEQATGAALAQKAKDASKAIIFNNAKALIFSSMGSTDKAVATLKETLEMARDLGDRSEQAVAYNNLGDAYRKAGKLEEARKSFVRAQEIDSQQHFKLGLAYDYANLALVEEALGNFAKAKEDDERAIALSREIGHPVNEIKAQLSLGRIALAEKQAAAAERALNAGLERVLALHLGEWEWKYRLQLGRLAALNGKPQEALAQFEKGLAIVEPALPEPRMSAGTKTIDEEKGDLYDAAIETLAAENKAEEAFRLSERYRARAFLDFFGSTRPNFGEPTIQALLTREQEAAQLLSAAREDAARATGEAQKQAQEALDAAENAHTQSLAALAAQSADLVSYAQVETARAAELLPLIPSGTVLLSYYAAPTHLLVWTLSAQGLSQQSLPLSRAELTQKIGAWREALVHFEPLDTQSAELYALLLAPIEAQLAGVSRLVIVPSGPLHQVSFAALRKSDKEDYLGDRFLLDYLSSVNELRYVQTKRVNTSADIAILAIGNSFPAGAPGLAPLPFTRHELRGIAKSYPGLMVLNDAQAGLERVRELAPNAAILHIASHIKRDDVNPFASSIVLTPSGKDDGEWRLSDVLAKPLKAQLVVLSACEGALGPLGNGDAMIGLSRAFLSANADQVLSSLWRVSDLSTAVLMKHFYRKLDAKGPEAALQAAQRSVRKNFPHPAYWAGFRLEGRLN